MYVFICEMGIIGLFFLLSGRIFIRFLGWGLVDGRYYFFVYILICVYMFVYIEVFFYLFISLYYLCLGVYIYRYLGIFVIFRVVVVCRIVSRESRISMMS